jgi:sulfite exporter TauE/SafE
MDLQSQLTVILGALTAGLLAGFGHCIGMCGPLVSTTVLDASRRTFWQKTLAQLLYHTGRITTYGWVGALMGWTGSFVNVAGNMVGMQNAVALFAGIFMAVRGLEVLGLLRWKLIERIESRIGFLLKGVRPLQTVDSVWRYYLLGLFLGLLPCGLSYSAFLGAAGTGGAGWGFLFTFAFGLGTIPALFLLGSMVSALSVKLRGWLYRAGGLSLFLLGLLFLYRALSGMISL